MKGLLIIAGIAAVGYLLYEHWPAAASSPLAIADPGSPQILPPGVNPPQIVPIIIPPGAYQGGDFIVAPHGGVGAGVMPTGNHGTPGFGVPRDWET